MSFNIEVEGGKSVRLPTAGKYCDRDIVVTATGNAGGDGYDEGYEAGQQAEYDRFWDAYQENGTKTNYYRAFVEQGWDDECFNPKYPITCIGGNSNGQYVFDYCSQITRIPVPVIVTGIPANNICNRCTRLVTAHFVFNGVTSFTNSFSRCDSLENLTIEGSIDVNFNISATAVLSAASVQYITDALADLTGKTTQTLTVHQEVRNRMTADQVNTIVNVKNWTLAPAESTS